MVAESPCPPDPTTRLSAAEARLNDFAREQRGLDARLRQLEGQVPPPPAARHWYTRVPWEHMPAWLQAIATPLMVAVVAYFLTGSLDLAIKQQQTNISGVKEMREALKDLYAAEPEKSAVETAALAMAAYGGIAAGPLVEAVNLGGAARVAAAKRGLIAAALLDEERVCAVLMSVASAESSVLYTVEARDVAKQLKKELQC